VCYLASENYTVTFISRYGKILHRLFGGPKDWGQTQLMTPPFLHMLTQERNIVSFLLVLQPSYPTGPDITMARWIRRPEYEQKWNVSSLRVSICRKGVVMSCVWPQVLHKSSLSTNLTAELTRVNMAIKPVSEL